MARLKLCRRGSSVRSWQPRKEGQRAFLAKRKPFSAANKRPADSAPGSRMEAAVADYRQISPCKAIRPESRSLGREPCSGPFPWIRCHANCAVEPTAEPAFRAVILPDFTGQKRGTRLGAEASAHVDRHDIGRRAAHRIFAIIRCCSQKSHIFCCEQLFTAPPCF